MPPRNDPQGPDGTGASPLERLGFGSRAGVVVIGPLFSDPGMRSKAVEGDLAGTTILLTIWLSPKFAGAIRAC